MLRNALFRNASFVILAALLASGVRAQAPGSLPTSSDYRGEIRRGTDGKLMLLPNAEPASLTPAIDAASAGSGGGGNRADSGAAGARAGISAKLLDPGPPDMTCLAGGATLSASERTLVAMPADSWLSLPGTAFRTFCKARENKALQANGDCTMAIDAWSGGVFDERLRRLLVIGGGHMDYWGNEVYGFDLASGAWTMVKAASGLGASNGPTEPMPDGNPVSRHTYDGLAYMSHLSQVFMFGGSVAPQGDSSDMTWWFSPANATWRAKAKAPSTSAGHFYMASAYDPGTRQVYVRNESAFFSYDPDADRWSGPIVNFGYPPYYPRMKTHHYRRGVILPAQRLFFAAGGMLDNPAAPDVFVYHLDDRREVTREHSMSGDISVIGVAGSGLDADVRTGSLVAWTGGAPAIMDPATWYWRRGSARGAPPKAVANGTFGRFRYISYLNVFILVNKPEEDVYFYKLSAGCGAKDSSAPPATRR